MVQSKRIERVRGDLSGKVTFKQECEWSWETRFEDSWGKRRWGRGNGSAKVLRYAHCVWGTTRWPVWLGRVSEGENIRDEGECRARARRAETADKGSDLISCKNFGFYSEWDGERSPWWLWDGFKVGGFEKRCDMIMARSDKMFHLGAKRTPALQIYFNLWNHSQIRKILIIHAWPKSTYYSTHLLHIVPHQY